MKNFVYTSLFLSILFSLFFLYTKTAQCQNIYENQKKVNRILFILDASGSMLDQWQGSTRFHIAKNLLTNVLDSIGRTNNKVEFGLRVFGHQYHKNLNNCKDSKLEIPFIKNNMRAISNKLEKITPQGWTPIAYSLFLSMNDFPVDPYATNAIILITDGIENCEGDPCAVGLELQKKRIALKPFIIGLGIAQSKKVLFDCVGTYYDASNKKSFHKVLNVIVSQALNTTTTQVNLLNQYEKPKETNVEMTFYDAFSGEERYNFLHTMNEQGVPDILYLDPAGKYDLVVHTSPPVEKKKIELIPGKHNIIAVDAPQGSLKITMENFMTYKSIQSIIRKAESEEILLIQDINKTQKYLTGKYDLEILTIPRSIYKNVSVDQSKTTEIKLPNPGNLYIYSSESGIGSIYKIQNERYVKIYDFSEFKGRITLSMQPGIYLFVYRPKKVYDSELTQEQTFKIHSLRTTNLQF